MGVAKVAFAVISIAFAILVYFILKPRTFEPIKPLKEKWWGKGGRVEESADIKSFQLKFDEGLNDDLQRRLRSTRYIDTLEDVGWAYGMKTDFLKTVIDYWLHKFSWEDQVPCFNHSMANKKPIEPKDAHGYVAVKHNRRWWLRIFKN